MIGSRHTAQPRQRNNGTATVQQADARERHTTWYALKRWATQTSSNTSPPPTVQRGGISSTRAKCEAREGDATLPPPYA